MAPERTRIPSITLSGAELRMLIRGIQMYGAAVQGDAIKYAANLLQGRLQMHEEWVSRCERILTDRR